MFFVFFFSDYTLHAFHQRFRHMDERRRSSTGREISCRCLAEHTEAALREQKRTMSARNVMSVRILVNKNRYCRGTQVVNGRVSRVPGKYEETALFLALLNTSLLVKPINIQAKSLCATGFFFFLYIRVSRAEMCYKCSAFPLFQPFRQWEFWLERIPGLLPGMAQISCGL